MTYSKTKSEFLRFIMVGTLTVLIDYVFYQLASSFDLSINISKALGFCFGTVFAYFSNQYWTFSSTQKKSSPLWRFIFIYGINLSINIYLNNAMFLNLSPSTYAFILAFFVATGTSATLNFLGMKYFVFSTPKNRMESK